MISGLKTWQKWTVLCLWMVGGPAIANVEAPPQGGASAQAPSAPAVSSAELPKQITLEELLKIRDPFRKPEVAGVLAGEPKSELEAHALDQFKVIGIMRGLGAPRAMLLTPSGKTHFVRENQRIGLKGGRILRITYETVVVREKATNILGKEESFDTEINLAPEFVKEVTSQKNQSW